jgi:two-component sensor histidine kinase
MPFPARPSDRAGPDQPRIPTPRPLGDPARLAALAAFPPTDAESAERIGRLAALASRVSGAPGAGMTLLDDRFQTFVSAHGIAARFPRTGPVGESFCRDVVEGAATVRIEDGPADPAFPGHPALAGFGIDAYLGVPVATPEGHVLGAFCLMDSSPRRWTDGDVETLGAFADAAMSEMALATERDVRVREARAPTDDALEASGRVGTWTLDADKGAICLDRHAMRLLGSAASVLDTHRYAKLAHPDDAGAVAAFWAGLAAGTAHAVEHRVVRPDGAVAWIELRGGAAPGPAGSRRRAGVACDVTRLRNEARRQADLNAEMGHRMKNLMATVQSIVFQTLRESGGLGSAAEAVTERMAALARSHDLILANGWGPTAVSGCVGLLTDYFGRARFEVSGPDLDLPARASLALSMALHELATNAVKYGALSSASGTVRILWFVDMSADGGRLVMTWSESGGPPVASPSRRGLGTRLLDRVLSAELHGRTRLSFEPGGLRCLIEGDLGAISREQAAADRA